jgi:hypothetical protein
MFGMEKLDVECPQVSVESGVLDRQQVGVGARFVMVRVQQFPVSQKTA